MAYLFDKDGQALDYDDGVPLEIDVIYHGEFQIKAKKNREEQNHG